MVVKLVVNKDKVLDEVAKTTSYIGAKTAEELAYDRIFTTDEDKDILERFWNEGKVLICNAVKRVLTSETENKGDYAITLTLPYSFNSNLTQSIQDSMFSFFVATILAKWFQITNKEAVTVHANEAAGYLEDIKTKINQRQRPKRPIYDTML